MTDSEEQDKKEPRGWLATIKKLLGILFGILIVAFLIAVFLFGDLLRTGGQ